MCPSASSATSRSRRTVSGALTARAMLALSRDPSSWTAGGSSSGNVAMPADGRDRAEPVPGGLCLGRLLGSRQLADRGLGVGGPHQRLADQDGVDADALELLNLPAVRDAGLRHHGLAG